MSRKLIGRVYVLVKWLAGLFWRRNVSSYRELFKPALMNGNRPFLALATGESMELQSFPPGMGLRHVEGSPLDIFLTLSN